MFHAKRCFISPPFLCTEFWCFIYSKEAIYAETQGWDVFQVLEPEDYGHGNEKLVKISLQIIKLFTYLLVFLLVLVSAVVAKACILFMTSNAVPGKKIKLCGETDST